MATIKPKAVIKKDFESFLSILNQASFTAHDFLFDSLPYTSGHLQIINQLSHLLPTNKKVLDLGCGSGLTSFLLAKNYQVTAVDVFESSSTQFYKFSRNSQKHLWQLLSKKRTSLNFKFYNGHKLEYPDSSFDLIFAHAVIEHVHTLKLKKLLSELKRVLKPHGYIVIARTPDQFALTEFLVKSHDTKFNLNQLKNLFPPQDYRLVYFGKTDFFPEMAPFSLGQKIINFLYPLTNMLDKLVNRSPLKVFSHHHLLFFQKL